MCYQMRSSRSSIEILEELITFQIEVSENRASTRGPCIRARIIFYLLAVSNTAVSNLVLIKQ